jgi:cell division septum initiation protein DivIVA
MKAAEQQLAAVTQRSEQLRLEAEKLRADSDRKSKRTMDDAARRADDLIAEAKATAERIRTESERELSAATQRRDSINSQLTNVRQMLATLTGASLPDPLADTGPADGDDKGDAGKGTAAAAEGEEPAEDATTPGTPPSNVVASDDSPTEKQSVSPEKPAESKR